MSYNIEKGKMHSEIVLKWSLLLPNEKSWLLFFLKTINSIASDYLETPYVENALHLCK